MKAKVKDNDYFLMFVELVEFSRSAALFLKESVENFDYSTLEQSLEHIHKIEHDADIAKHALISKLAKEFIAPLDREDIIRLAEEIDDVTDNIEEALRDIYMYDIRVLRPEAAQFAQTIVKLCDSLKAVMEEFRNFKKSKDISNYIIDINHLEEDGDKIYTDAIRSLYSTSGNPIEILSWTRTFDQLEKCCDSCEHVADAIESVILKNT